MRKLVKSKKCVSEIVGVILMLGMAIALFTGVYIVAMDVIPFNPHTPSIRISGEIKNDLIYLQHNGGDSLSLDTKVIFSDISGTLIGDPLSLRNFNFIEDKKPIGIWNIGEIIYYPNPGESGDEIQMIMVDIESNSIIAQDIFQEVK